MKLRFNYHLTLFFLILLFLLIGNACWVLLNQAPPDYDDAGHTVQTIIYAKILNGSFPIDGPISFLRQSNYYPPLMYWLATPAMWLFGYQYKVLQYLSLLFIPLSGFFLYMLVSEWTKNQRIALLSAIFFVLSPQIWEQSRYFMFDLPLTTWIIISIYFLVKSENYSKTLPTLLAFLFAVFGQLTKWYSIVFLIFPYAWYLWLAVEEKRDWKILIKNIGLGLLLASVLTLPWYIVNFANLLYETTYFSRPHANNPTSTFSFYNVFYYLAFFANYQVVSIFFLWWIISLGMVIKSSWRYKWPLLSYLLVVYAIFTFLGNKNYRFLMPLVPFACVLMGYGVEKARELNKVLAHTILGILVFFGVMLFSINSFAIPLNLDSHPTLPIYRIFPGIHFWLVDFSSDNRPYRFQRQDWKPLLVIQDLHQLSDYRNTSVLVATNNSHASSGIFEIFRLNGYLHLHLSSVPFYDQKPLDTTDAMESFLEPFDYVIIPETLASEDGDFGLLNRDALRKYILGGQTRSYEPVKTYQLPSGENLYLLKKNEQGNRLEVVLTDKSLILSRQVALTKIFIQTMDTSLTWNQIEIAADKEMIELDISTRERIRIDYPPELIDFSGSTSWVWDGDKQFDRLLIDTL